MRPLAIAVVMVGVVLLALGTWLILRASIGSPRKPRPPRPAPRPAPPPPAPQVADRPRTAIAFPPAAVARTSAPVEDAPWQRPEPESRRPDEELVAEAVHEPVAQEEPIRDAVPAPGPAGERVGPDEELAEEAAALDLPAGAAAWGSPVPPAEEPAAPVSAEEVPVDEGPADEGPADEGPADEGPADEPPAEPEPAAAEAPAPQDEAEQAASATDEAAPAGEVEAPAGEVEAPAEDVEVPPVGAEATALGEPAEGEPAEGEPAKEAPEKEAPEEAPAAGAGAAGAAAAGAVAGWAARRRADDVPEVAPRSSFAESLAAQADESHEQPRPTPPVPPGDAVMPMGTVLGGSGAYPPLPPPTPPPPPPPAPPTEQEADPLQDWAQERPAGPGHQLGPVVGQQGSLPDLGATPPGGETDDDWAARFGALAEQLGEPRPTDQPPEPSDQPWPGRSGPDESSTGDVPGSPLPPGEPQDWRRREPQPPPAQGEPPSPFGQQPPGRDDRSARYGQEPPGRREEPGGRGGEPFGRPYGQQPGPLPPYRPTGPEPPRAQEQGPQTPRAASRQAGTRSHRGRPEDPRQAAVYDALTINEQVLDEVWTSPSVDVLKVVSSIVVNALDAYEDDPAEYADWVAVHRTGNCDCH